MLTFLGRGWASGLLVLAFWMLSIGAGFSESAQRIIRLGTAPPGAPSFPFMVGVATIVNKQVPELALTTQVTGGSIANVRLLHEKQIEMGLISGMTFPVALAGKKPFKEKMNVLPLFAMYPQRFFYMARKGANINGWEDLAGKKIAVGTPGGSTREVGDLVAKAKSVDKKGKVLYMRAGSMIEALRDGTIHAGWATDAAGVPSTVAQEMLATMDVKFFGVDKETAGMIASQTGGLLVGDVPKGYFKGGAYDSEGNPPFSTLVEYLFFGVRANEDERTTYLITKAVIEQFKELSSFWPGAKNMVPADLAKGLPPNINHHAGAARAFKEKGLLK